MSETFSTQNESIGTWVERALIARRVLGKVYENAPLLSQTNCLDMRTQFRYPNVVNRSIDLLIKKGLLTLSNFHIKTVRESDGLKRIGYSFQSTM